MIQKLSRGELLIIQQLAHEIWPICFKEMISKEQIDYMLDWMYSTNQLEENFDKGHEFIVLKAGDENIGFASFEIKTTKENIRLHKLYVNPNKHNKGSGRKLLYRIIETGINHNCNSLDLFVNRTNPAVSFYKKLGFKIVESIDLEIGNAYYMNDYRMKIEI
tara:strand:- start:8078 stop:8563 length:486 start_codon:yes stop_codon:yes gene_type:complete